MEQQLSREADYLPPYPAYRELEPKLMRLIRAIRIGTYFHSSCFDINIKIPSSGSNDVTATLTKAFDSENLLLCIRSQEEIATINQYRLQPFDIKKLVNQITKDIHKFTYHLFLQAND